MTTRWKPLPRLLGISPGDQGRGRELSWLMPGAVENGLRLLVLREPQLDTRQMIRLVRRLLPILGEDLIIHARCSEGVEIARRCGTGLHLAADMDPSTLRSDIRGWFGKSCHDAHDLESARDGDCDYVTLSPVFPPLSKPDDHRSTLGVEGLASLCARTEIPVMALGGMTPDRVGLVTKAGAYGIASMGGVFPGSSTPEETGRYTSAFIEALRNSEHGVPTRT